MLLDDNGLVVRPAPAPIPNGPAAVADVLAHARRERPDHEALVGRHNRYTFRALDLAADAAAAALHRCGIEPGDRVAASLPNHCEIVIAYLGAMRLGAVWVGINMALAPPEKRYMLDDSEARLFITTPAIRDTLVDAPSRVLVVDPSDGTGDWPDLVDAHHACDPPRPPIDPHAPAAISYTSGTTGFPKGAVHSQHNMLWQGAVARETDPGPSDERHGVVLPLTLLNLMVLGPLFAWLKDTTCICIDRVDAVGLRDWLRDESVTRVTFAPPIAYDLLNHPGGGADDIAALRRPECGGAATPQSLRTLFVERFGTGVLTGYGLTEAPGGLTREMPGDPMLAGCSGKPLTPIEIVILDEQDRPVPAGTAGEICARAVNHGPWAGVYTPFLGYWRRPDATRRALRGGLLHTEDIGELDDDGRLFVKDRRTDLIVRGGANVYPAEVERILADHPAIAACAVLGLADERLGQRVGAVLQLRPDCVVAHDDIAAYCRERLARYKVPERWVSVEAFARTPMGKIRKGDLTVLFD
ncbi:MAG TPA: AMP-binding protein [Acidimicrobiales bacterium]|nr:AMP-binding protein [Acidimicrobiales bacterium]